MQIDRSALAAKRGRASGASSLEGELRDLRGDEHAEALESERRCAWLIEQRREHGGGPEEARRAELTR